MEMENVAVVDLLRALVHGIREVSVNRKHRAGGRPDDVANLHSVGKSSLLHRHMGIYNDRLLALVCFLCAGFDYRIDKRGLSEDFRHHIGNDHSADDGQEIACNA